MEKTRSNYEDYWNELQELHREAKNVDDYPDEENTKQFPEGEQESDWLRDVGLDNLTEIFQQGREITDSELNACISLFSNQHAEAVKKRVRSLNQTVSNRYRQQRGRHRKPDIRDVFRDMETSSTGTRSRSATPDSLDFVDVDADMEDEWNDCPHTQNTASRETLRRSPSAPTPKIQVRSGHDMFKKSGNWHGQRLNVASDSEGIELLGYQRFGTMPRGLTERARSESDPSVTISSLDIIALEKAEPEPLSYRNRFHNEVSRSHNNLFQSAEEASGPVSFENFCREAEPIRYVTELDDSSLIEIDALSDAEYSQLKPLLWLEVSAIFDKYSVEFHKKKPYKRKRKEHGNVFGVSLSTLVMRDRRISNDNSTVPQIFKIILGELETRCCREEGILRIAGQKQRVETLCSEIEAHFYTKPEEVRHLLKNSLCHELIAVLKKLLRDLPQPLLTSELVNLFYKIHELPTVECQCKVLNLLVLLLPLEHSGTLRTLMSFLDSVIRNEKYNKMSLHNVAMIIAPSLFPPKYVHPLEKSDLNDQVKMAAVCCRLVEVLLQYRLDFWRIPTQLRLQLQQKIQSVAARKLKSGQSKHVRRKEKEPLRRSNTQYDSSSRMYTAVRL